MSVNISDATGLIFEQDFVSYTTGSTTIFQYPGVASGKAIIVDGAYIHWTNSTVISDLVVYLNDASTSTLTPIFTCRIKPNETIAFITTANPIVLEQNQSIKMSASGVTSGTNARAFINYREYTI